MSSRAHVLVVGRSPSVLRSAIELIRSNGHLADATNQFETVLDDYDVADLDVLVFGGMVPPDTRQFLHEEIARRNAEVSFVQGLVGIPGVIAAQVDSTLIGVLSEDEAAYDEVARAIIVDLAEPGRTTIEFSWITSWTPPEPSSTSLVAFDGELAAATHVVAIPDEVPPEASYAVVTVGRRVRVLTLGPLPEAVTRMAPRSAADGRLPEVEAVTTGSARRDSGE